MPKIMKPKTERKRLVKLLSKMYVSIKKIEKREV